MKLIPSIISLSLLLTSCDPGHSIKITIENQTNKSVVLISQTFDKDKLILSPYESRTVRESGLGGYKALQDVEFCPCADSAIQLYTLDTTLKITKDIKNPDNWFKTSRRINIKSGTFTCKFTLTNQDIK
jgi:hypothetical protein